MSFEEFQNRARLYVIGALENGECGEFEDARRNFGQPAEEFITECYRLHEGASDEYGAQAQGRDRFVKSLTVNRWIV